MTDVMVFTDDDGETYLARSLAELWGWMRGELGVEPDPAEKWRVIRDWRESPIELKTRIRDHLDAGGPVPTQIATTYA